MSKEKRVSIDGLPEKLDYLSQYFDNLSEMHRLLDFSFSYTTMNDIKNRFNTITSERYADEINRAYERSMVTYDDLPFPVRKVMRTKKASTIPPIKQGGTMQELEVSAFYTIKQPDVTGKNCSFQMVSGRVSCEYERFYTIECTNGLTMTILKNDLCMEATKIKKISQ